MKETKVKELVVDNIACSESDKQEILSFIDSWITAKISLNTIYINLCNDKKQLLKVEPGTINIIKNVLLKKAPNVSGIEYDSIDISQGMKRLKELLFNNFACSEENKFYVFVFLIATFFVDFVNAKGLLKASGDTSSGKTTAARLLTWIKKYIDSNIKDNPFEYIEKFPEIKTKKYIPPVKDFWKVYNTCNNQQDKLMLLTYLYTAGRRNEIFQLTWNDIDFDQNTIH